jgi:hypothetical protein
MPCELAVVLGKRCWREPEDYDTAVFLFADHHRR